MNERLILNLGQTPADPVIWGGATGQVVNELGRISELSEVEKLSDRFNEEVSIEVVLPGELVAQRTMPNPPRNRAKFLSASKYLLEDDLGEDTDDLHIAVETVEDDGRIYAINKESFESWLSALKDVGIEPTTVSVDFACLGGTKAHPVFVLSAERVMASAGARGFAADETLASFVAPALDAENSDELSAYGDQRTLFEITQRKPTNAGRAEDSDLLKFFAENIGNAGAVNFLQGDYKRKVPLFTGIKEWRRPAALAAGLVFCVLAYTVSGGIRDQRIADRYQTAAVDLYQNAYPDVPKSELRRHAVGIVNSQSASASFLKVSQTIASVIEGSEVLSIDRIRFDSGRSSYVMAIRSQSDGDIEAFRNQLAAVGIIAEDNGGYRRSGNAWVAEMTARLQ